MQPRLRACMRGKLMVHASGVHSITAYVSVFLWSASGCRCSPLLKRFRSAAQSHLSTEANTKADGLVQCSELNTPSGSKDPITGVSGFIGLAHKPYFCQDYTWKQAAHQCSLDVGNAAGLARNKSLDSGHFRSFAFSHFREFFFALLYFCPPRPEEATAK